MIDSCASGTGQLIDLSKCSITFSASYPQADQDDVRMLLQVEKENFEATYLRLPTPDGRMHKEEDLKSNIVPMQATNSVG
jgi:hypothetical protein